MTDLISSITRRPGPLGLLLALPDLYLLHRSRQSLAHLDHNRLRDIGLSPAAAQAESTRSFWDAPSHWLR